MSEFCTLNNKDSSVGHHLSPDPELYFTVGQCAKADERWPFRVSLQLGSLLLQAAIKGKTAVATLADPERA
jgi:hypothetical protein